MGKRFILSDYIDENNDVIKEDNTKNKIFTPSMDIQPTSQKKTFNINEYLDSNYQVKDNNNIKNKVFSPLGAVENTAPPPTLNNKTFYSNKGTPIKFNSLADEKASKAGSYAAGLANGASLGLIPKILDHFQPGMSKEAEESNPTAYTLGNLSGYIAPGVGLSKGAKALSETKLLKPIASKFTNPLVNRVLEGAAVGSTMTGVEDWAKGKSLDETLHDIKWNAGIGAGLDLALHGAGKVIPKIFSKVPVKNEVAEAVPKAIPSKEVTVETPKINKKDLIIQRNEISKKMNIALDNGNYDDFDLYHEQLGKINNEITRVKNLTAPQVKIGDTVDVKMGSGISKNNKIINIQDDGKIQLISDGGMKITVEPHQINKIETIPEKEVTEIIPQTTNTKSLIDLDIDNINDEATLKNHIADLETAMTTADSPTMQKMNLQLFAAKEKLKKMQSKVYSNTLQKTDVLSQAEKELLNPKDFQYDVKTEKASLDEARKRIDTNMPKEIIDLNHKQVYSGSDVDTMMGILDEKYLKEARETGDYSNVKDWLKNIRKAGTEGGRTVQAFAKYSRTKEGALVDAQRVVDNVEDGLKKTNPKLLEEINNEAKQVEDTLNTAHKDTVEEVAKEFDTPKDKKELLPSEILANKIKSTINPKSPQEKSLIDKMVNELFNVAKESPIENNMPKVKPNALDSVSEALNNRELYSTVWKNAKDIVSEHFKDNPEAMTILNNYFDKGIKPPFSMSKFNTAFNQGLKDLNINMGEVVRNYYKTGKETKEGLINYLVEKSGLSGDQAQSLANTIDSKFREVKKQKAEEYLKNIFKEKTLSKTSNPLNKIEALSNTGGFVNENYKNKVKEKLTPELRKLIGFNPKEVKVKDPSIISFEDIVRGGVGKVGAQRKLFLDSLRESLNVNPKDAETILKTAEKEFNKLAKDKQTQILNNMFKEKEKPQQKNIVNKVLDLINLEAYDKESIRDLIKEKKGLPVLDSNDIKFITENMEKSLAAPEGSYEQRMYYSKVQQLIAEKEPSNFMDKFKAAQRISLLPNPKTLITRNPGGNVLMAGLKGVRDIPGAGIDFLTSLKTKEKTTTLPSIAKAKAYGQGFGKGLKEWALDIKNDVHTSPTGAQVEMPKKVNIFNENVNNPVQRTVNKAANKIHSFVGRVLELGDRPFYEGSYNMRIAELKKINKTDIVTDAMKSDADLQGLISTFQNDSAVASLFTGIKDANFLNKHPGGKFAFQLFANLISPFAKTPANALDQFVNYTPLGTFKAVGHAVSTMGKSTVEKKVFNQKKFVDTLASSMTGTGLSVLGYLLAKKGILTGARNSNNKLEGVETALGKQNYAYKIGDTYHSYDWSIPASAPIAMGADVYYAMSKAKDGQNAVLKGTESAVNLMFNSTLLQTPAKLMSGYSPAVSLGNSLLGTTTQITPTFGKQISKLSDTYERETYAPNSFEQTLNKIKSGIPSLRKTLPTKVDLFGNDIKVDQGQQGIKKSFDILLNPGTDTKFNPSEIQKEIIRLYEDSGETKQLPPTADKIINATKKTKTTPAIPKIILTGSELSQYQKIIGKYSLKAYNDVISSSSYKHKTDEDKAKELGSKLEEAKAKAKLEFLKGKGVIK